MSSVPHCNAAHLQAHVRATCTGHVYQVASLLSTTFAQALVPISLTTLGRSAHAGLAAVQGLASSASRDAESHLLYLSVQHLSAGPAKHVGKDTMLCKSGCPYSARVLEHTS